jgi:hypothetical protein
MVPSKNFELRIANCGFLVARVKPDSERHATRLNFQALEQNSKSAIRNPQFEISFVTQRN